MLDQARALGGEFALQGGEGGHVRHFGDAARSGCVVPSRARSVWRSSPIPGTLSRTMTLLPLRSPWLVSLVALSLLACTSTPEPRAAAPAARPVAVAPAAPEKGALERLLELGRSDNRVQEHLQYLSLEIGPRLTSSSQLQAACEWTRERFASFGLEAQLERWGEFPVGFDRGPWRGGMVAPEAQEFVFHLGECLRLRRRPQQAPLRPARQLRAYRGRRHGRGQERRQARAHHRHAA